MTDRKPNTKRTGERLVRLAYDLSDVVARLRAAGKDSEAEGVKSAASHLGSIGRQLQAN